MRLTVLSIGFLFAGTAFPGTVSGDTAPPIAAPSSASGTVTGRLPMERDGGSDAPALAGSGERIRIRMRDAESPLIGTLVRLDSSTLSLAVAGKSDPVQVHRSQLRSLEISGGRRSLGRRIARGVGVGFATGMTVGLAYTLIAQPCVSDPGRCERSLGDSLVVGLLFGGAFSVVTVPLGAAIGAATAGETWKTVDHRPRLEVALVPRTNRAALALRLRF
jgi:hypothetical protein